jgi:hypothetical protein
MYITSNEIMIESVEIDLLVTEGLADKAKNVVDKVIKRIRELINKIINFIKGKLSKQTKQTEEVIKVVEKKVEAKEIEPEPAKPIKTLDIKKTENLQSAIEVLLDSVFRASSPITSDVNGDIKMVTEDLEKLKELNEKYAGQLIIKYTGDIMDLVHAMKKLNFNAELNLKMITQVEDKIAKKMDRLKTDLPDNTAEMFKLINLLQASVSFATHLNNIIISSISTTFLQIDN